MVRLDLRQRRPEAKSSLGGGSPQNSGAVGPDAFGQGPGGTSPRTRACLTPGAGRPRGMTMQSSSPHPLSPIGHLSQMYAT